MHFISIITVNFNGKRYIGDFLESIKNLDYPKNKYETLVVDNASTDGSLEYIKKNFPEVKILEANKNLGFSKGSNLGINNSKGDLIFLVNNDTFLESLCLKSAVDCFDHWSKVGKIAAVSPKIVLVDYYLPLVFRGADLIDYEVLNSKFVANNSPFIFQNDESRFFEEKVYIPINYAFEEKNLVIKFHLKKVGESNFKLFLGSKLAQTFKFDINRESKEVNLTFSKEEVFNSKIDLIQNAGNFIFSDGYGRDRGAEIVNKRQFYEVDIGQYDKEELIPSFCGAGVVLNKKALKDVGLFDEKFFMYYEDDDLSLRFKKKGWEILYCPISKIRHIHTASSKEWSSFFVFNVERNRLLLVAKHWPRVFAIKEFIKFLLIDTFGILYFIIFKVKKSQNLFEDPKKKFFSKFKTRMRIVFSLTWPFFVNLFRGQKFSRQEIQNFWEIN